MSHAEPSAASSIHIKLPAPEDTNPIFDSQELVEQLEDELDEDFDLGGFRERRMEEMRLQVTRMQAVAASDYGKYREIKSEKELIAASAKAKRSIIHFFHRDFKRCKIMDRHLEKLAGKYEDTMFLRAEVSNVPFLVTKMEVQVLPCVVGFISGVSKMKIVGFEELEGGDNFTTASLELTMLQCDVVIPPGSAPLKLNRPGTTRRGIRSQNHNGDSEEEDY